MKRSVLATLTLIAGLGADTALAEPQAEVLHWWTSGGEARAVQTLMDEFQSNGGKWVDMPVAGGGGDAAMQALRARVLAGNAPTAVQLKGPSIQEWYEEGVLADLSGVGKAEKWDLILPAAIAGHMKCGGKYCAAPVNVHRVNWIWANTAVLARAGVSIPTSWDEFNAAAVKLKALGITPLAHGGQAWQDATVFESVVLGIGGPAFYQKALVDLDPASLNSATMVKVFDQMRTLRGFVDSNFSGREWNRATAMVINGDAAFQIMGDWAKGEFTAAGKTPGKDYQCNPTPGAGFLYNVDSFAMFKVSGADRDAGQKLLAKLIVGENFQKTFNLAKGSIPARLGTPLAEFDYCARRSAYDMDVAASSGTLLPSYAHGMALRGQQAGAITDLVTQHFNSDMSSAQAAKSLADAVANSR